MDIKAQDAKLRGSNGWQIGVKGGGGASKMRENKREMRGKWGCRLEICHDIHT